MHHVSDKILTVSIAAYNVEKTLPKLLESLIIKNVIGRLQILIINDGSTDNTVSVAKKYVAEYPKSIFLINKKNGGHGSTINEGIKLAKGKYFKMIDGDDWVTSDGLIEVVNRLEKENADIVIHDYIDYYEYNDSEQLEKICKYKDNTFLETNKFLTGIEWVRFHGIIYKTSLLKFNRIKLSEKVFYDDIQYIMYPLPYARTVRYYSIPLYCYRLGRIGQSISIEGRKKHIKDAFLVGKEITLFIKKERYDPSLFKYMQNGVVNHWKWYIGTLMSFDINEYTNVNFDELINFLRHNAENIDCILQKQLFVYRCMTKNRLLNKIIFFFYKMKRG